MAISVGQGFQIFQQGLKDLSGGLKELRDSKERSKAAELIEQTIPGTAGEAFATDVRRGISTAGQAIVSNAAANRGSLESQLGNLLNSYYNAPDDASRAKAGEAVKVWMQTYGEFQAAKENAKVGAATRIEAAKGEVAKDVAEFKSSLDVQKKQATADLLIENDPKKLWTTLTAKIAQGKATPEERALRDEVGSFIKDAKKSGMKPGEYLVDLMKRDANDELSKKEKDNLEKLLSKAADPTNLLIMRQTDGGLRNDPLDQVLNQTP